MIGGEEFGHSERSETLRIEERGFVDVCGWHVCLDSIWIDNGTIKADLVMWSDGHMKPLTGGYEKGSEVRIGTTECTYYVREIKKYGKNNERPGYLILSIEKPKNTQREPCSKEEIIEETTRARIGEVEFGLGSIRKTEEGKLAAHIHPPQDSPLGEPFTLCEGDNLWVGVCAYGVERIIDGHTTEDGRYVNGCVVLKKLERFIGEGITVPGELMSQLPFKQLPNTSSERQSDE
ncbi:MAG: hypothetical protein ACTSP1_19460 [Candidatus Freyarchaeota archaeon]